MEILEVFTTAFFKKLLFEIEFFSSTAEKIAKKISFQKRWKPPKNFLTYQETEEKH